ncbi:hypothetical protein BDW59DRAFT_109893 [Aspergillus cavernicola]|uniref:EthD domain-containing protein n=1 Tax=Aspergillus cavernicola TaxID=176166 RepID=A0ABR4I125_9EURO
MIVDTRQWFVSIAILSRGVCHSSSLAHMGVPFSRRIVTSSSFPNEVAAYNAFAAKHSKLGNLIQKKTLEVQFSGHVYP